jgi:diguanylate cyclase (GGDEF)-like protein
VPGYARLGARMGDSMTTGIAIAALALGAVAVALFAIALRRSMTRQTEIVETMLLRYDDRLATFAQTLNDTLTSLPARQAVNFGAVDDSEPMMRALEIAVSETSADGAVALVTGGSGAPVVATIGLSEAETNHIARMGFPDYRGARAIEVAFSGDVDAPEGSPAIRSGLVVPLLSGEPTQSLLGVLTRDEGRRFSEEDVAALDDLVTRARPAITRSLNLREPDVVPELDMLTGLYDKHSFESVLDHQIARARLAQRPLFLLLIDVDRLTTLNAKIGRLAADGALLAIAERLRTHVDRFDYTFRLAGGQFAVIRRGGSASDAHELFETFRSDISSQPLDEAGFVSVSAGFSELLPIDDAASLAGRAEESLADAKQLRRGAAADGA